MASAEIKEQRRLQLIEATIGAIAQRGFADLTLAEVARRAKLSQGIVNFYFASKEELLKAALAHMVEEYDEFWHGRLAKAGASPAQRLWAMVEADFDPVIANRKKVTVWYAFWGEARWRPEYLRLCAMLSDRYFEQTRALCRDLVEAGRYAGTDPDLVARGLNAIVDGLWLDLLVNPKGIDRALAKRTCRAFLAHAFPRHFVLDATASAA